ncbi:MAG TPA: right-handed parallel beta-helix repeat-containing protein [Candidatus Acidoferrum sp.]|nr:right-handed parallel beta-helix repeat-containing protein [Candidatus Acidoferrum sp.]
MKAIGIAIGFAVALFVFPNAARAQFLVVDCSGLNPYAFPSISSALPSAGPGAFIAVTGTCNENVTLYGVNNLMLGAFFGQTANVVGSLNVINSQGVYLYGLNISNAFGDGVYVQSSHGVVLDTCTSSGNVGNGLTVAQVSDVTVNAFGTFSNNAGYGISTGDNSFVNINSWGGTTEVSNNQVGAVRDEGAFSTLGNTHMANNGPIPNADLRVAIDMRGAGRAQIGSVYGPNVIENNINGGVSLQENSEISFWALTSSGPNIIRNNGPFGIKAGFGSQVTLVGDQIYGHTGPGVDIYAHSQLYATSQLPGLSATQITNNGTAGDPLSAGIRMDGGSEALLRGVTISQNIGPAILALVNSSVDFAGNTFTGNAAVITCDSSSNMVSDLGITARTPAAGVSCNIAHTLGNRVASVPAPAVPDVTVWKKLHSNYQQRSAARK